MSLKTAFLTSLFVGLLTLSFVQFSQLQNVHAADAPLTPPVTAPESLFTVSGKITQKSLHTHPFFWRFMPIEGVKVTLENIFTHTKKTTMTDSDGSYSFGVDEKGIYKIVPSAKKSDGFAVPPLRFVTLKKHDTLHEDFQLLDLH